ncbi:MAG: phosphomannomutase/phosphoglucomutase [Actinomycetota bacterium]|nr:phosphomannomutase/phosphoglucomutase [Dehalococcoidia bacterium]MEC7908907.1 phosphomannomutase/phosphoglucomutase [Actinomycetota bacterium]
MAKAETVFKAYDIRGIFPKEVNEELFRKIGRAFSIFIKNKTHRNASVIVGRDMRNSSEALAEAFAAGVMDQGLNIVDIGLASTDMCYFASGHFDSPAAMVTASHNPSEYNGLKICMNQARPVGQDSGLKEILQIVNSNPQRQAATGSIETIDILEDFAAHACSIIDTSNLRELKVVADTANGMGGLILPPVFNKLPFELEILFPELDGSFPNHPADPLQQENQEYLRKRVIDVKADIGLAFDGDADRVFLLDEKGNPVSGSLTTALIADQILKEKPGESVIYNLICSKVVPEVISAHDGKGIRSRVGHSFIKQLMEKNNAIFAGEHSGHYYFRENYRADSGVIAALVVLKALSQHQGKLSELLEPFSKYESSGELNFSVSDVDTSINQIAEHYKTSIVDWLDGLTVDLGDWWFNLRPSNTEPLLRLNIEANDNKICEQAIEEVRTLLSQ